MVLDIISRGEEKLSIEKIAELIRIVNNSVIHLQNIIEDALDISRIENNNFQINKEILDIKNVVNEVCDIMNFQVQ